MLQNRGMLTAGRLKSLTAATAILAVVVGVGATVQVYRVGDSGAQATWQDQTGAQTAESE